MKLYLCDTKKNIECKKTHCQCECKHTTKKAYKMSRLKLILIKLGLYGGD